MKTLTGQLKELSRGAHYISPELKDEIIKIIKERDTYVIGEDDSMKITPHNSGHRNDLRAEQRKRAEESL